MKRATAAVLALLGCGISEFANANNCADGKLGTHRVLEVPVSTGPVGDISYRGQLPLARGEVVLTFDDGPMPHRTTAVLDALKAECVRATFFVVGTMARQFPSTLRRVAADGHTIASHSWSHAYLNRVRSDQRRRDEINGGLLAVSAVLGPSHPALSAFFRFPGLGKTRALEAYVADQNLISMSADIVGDDWKPISSDQVLHRVMRQLNSKGRGIILLHDIQKRTSDMVPALLQALKAGGYKVVHVVPSARDTRTALALAEPPASARITTALAKMTSEANAFASRSPADASPMQLAAQIIQPDEPQSSSTAAALLTPIAIRQPERAQAASSFAVIAAAEPQPSFEELGLRR
uniref:Chitooligosaccharide deacetylase n=1 Tax=Bosea sp. NBC_00436 TaxID=2969620 RepID=A0A9E8CQK6_9HYPH